MSSIRESVIIFFSALMERNKFLRRTFFFICCIHFSMHAPQIWMQRNQHTDDCGIRFIVLLECGGKGTPILVGHGAEEPRANK